MRKFRTIIAIVATAYKMPAGLAKTCRLIRTQKNKEIQFLKLCAMIRLDDYKKFRAINQRDESRASQVAYLHARLVDGPKQYFPGIQPTST